jgi:AcrR family transcriptional regulator
MPAATSASADPHRPDANPRRRAGRPPSAVLDQDGITAAALQLVRKSGYDAFTMAALARALNVAPSALYNHVSSKRDVLVLIQDHLTSLVDVSAFGTEPWDQAVRDWAWSYRAVFSRHTPLIPVIAVLPVADAPKTLAMYEAVSTGLRRAGFPQERIVSAIVALESFVFGSAYDVNAPADIFASGSMAASTPNFSAAVDSLGEQGYANQADVAFSLGLEALIAGFGALRA